MSLIYVILAIAIVGLVLWLIDRYVPMEAGIKRLLNIVVIIFLIIWLLKALGVFHYLTDIRV